VVDASRALDAGLAYFHTNYLSTLRHDHRGSSAHALPAIVAATLLQRASVVTAQNCCCCRYIFANMASAYALVWDVAPATAVAPFLGGRDLRPVAVSGVASARTLRSHRGVGVAAVRPDGAPADGVGVEPLGNRRRLVFAATAYTAYYYVVYLAFFLARCT
jgi:hypothetical protein